MIYQKIEKAIDEYVRNNPFAHPYSVIATRESYRDGIYFALGKQEKDAEETVISGWVFVDDITFDRYLRVHKVTQGDYEAVWDSGEPEFCLGEELFPDMTPNSDPEPVEITIKRKKK